MTLHCILGSFQFPRFVPAFRETPQLLARFLCTTLPKLLCLVCLPDYSTSSCTRVYGCGLPLTVTVGNFIYFAKDPLCQVDAVIGDQDVQVAWRLSWS